MRRNRADRLRFKGIYTDTNMCDPDLRQRIEEALEGIKRVIEVSRPLPVEWELVLELGTDKETGDPICSYYFACHATRCILWLHYFDTDSVIADLCGVTEKAHIREFVTAPTIHYTKPCEQTSRCKLSIGGWLPCSRDGLFVHNSQVALGDVPIQQRNP